MDHMFRIVFAVCLGYRTLWSRYLSTKLNAGLFYYNWSNDFSQPMMTGEQLNCSLPCYVEAGQMW